MSERGIVGRSDKETMVLRRDGAQWGAMGGKEGQKGFMGSMEEGRGKSKGISKLIRVQIGQNIIQSHQNQAGLSGQEKGGKLDVHVAFGCAERVCLSQGEFCHCLCPLSRVQIWCDIRWVV